MASDEATTASGLGRGVVAGLAGTAVMSGFQRFVEMPLTGRQESFAPANFAEKVLPIRPRRGEARRQLNEVTHFALGAAVGVARAVAERAGLRGQRATLTAFAAMYTGDLLLNTALGLYRPSEWSGRDWAIDLVDKFVQAEATGLVFERLGRGGGR